MEVWTLVYLDSVEGAVAVLLRLDIVQVSSISKDIQCLKSMLMR
jgi:hypothetical protein